MNEELVRRVKEWDADPTKAPVLHDLLHGEATRVIEALHDQGFDSSAPYSKEELARRAAAYETLTEDLGRGAALVAYWSGTTDERLVPGLVVRLANAMERENGVVPWLEMHLYPALLVLYAGGLGAVVGRREEQLAGLLASAGVRQRGEWKPNVLVLHAHGAIDHRIAKDLPGLERRHTPISDHLAEILRPWLEELEPDQAAFERAFDRFEYLHGLVMFDLTRGGPGGGWAPVGRFSWRGERYGAVDQEVSSQIAAAGTQWSLLRAGLFGGDQGRLSESVRGWNEHIGRVRRQQW